jgi:hypothetical protein
MKTAVSKPKKSNVVTSQQPQTTQVPVPQQIKTPQVPAPQQAPRSMPSSTAKPTKEEIAKRAYEIYLQKGCQPGQCEQNWKQAELELKK